MKSVKISTFPTQWWWSTQLRHRFSLERHWRTKSEARNASQKQKLHNWGRLEVRWGRQRKVPQEDKLWGGRKKQGYTNVGHDDDSMATPQIAVPPSSSSLARSVELRQRKRWQAPSPHPPLFLSIKSKISNICVMQVRQGSTGEETINPAKGAWDNLLSLTFLLTLHFLQGLATEFAVSSIIVSRGCERNVLIWACFHTSNVSPQCTTEGAQEGKTWTNHSQHVNVKNYHKTIKSANSTLRMGFSMGWAP